MISCLTEDYFYLLKFKKLTQAKAMDAFTLLQTANVIHSHSKTRIIRKLQSFDEAMLKHILITTLSDIRPSIKPLISADFDTSTIAAVEFIKEKFKPLNGVQTMVKSKLLSLPSMIGANILSFCNMSDRRIFTLASKDCWKLNQIPIANNDLIINLNFVKHLVGSTQLFMNYPNAKHLALNFIYSVSRFRPGNLERATQRKYDLGLNRILSSSGIDSIGWNLTYKYAHNVLKKSTCKNEANKYGWNACVHGIVPFMRRFKINYKNIKKLTAVPITTASVVASRISLFQANEFEEFIKYFPNLEAFILPEFHNQHRICNTFDFCIKQSGIWSIFSKPYYWERLKRIDLNLKQLDTVHTILDIEQHPLFHIHKFKNLETLSLEMYCFEDYFEQILDRQIDATCPKLYSISLTFAESCLSVRDLAQLVDNIWKYVLSFSPNMQDYTSLVPFLDDDDAYFYYNHLLGHTDNLKTMKVSSFHFFNLNINFMSLQSLHINFPADYFDLYPRIDDIIEIVRAPKLESLTLSAAGGAKFCVKTNEWNGIILQFLKAFSKIDLANNPCLKSIRLLSRDQEYVRPWKVAKDIGAISTDLSMEICQLITSLSAKIKHIGLSPVKLKKKEMDFLSFWFDGEFGNISNNFEAWNKSKSTVVAALTLTNNRI